jgi:histidine triad (HIT) family protein
VGRKLTVNEDCIFCGIVAGGVPAQVVHRDDQTMAFMDINPATRGHLLVIPLAHAADIWELDLGQAQAVMATCRLLADRVRDTLQPDGLNLVQSNGAAAFQTVFHSHMHLVPRYHDDGLKLPWTPTPGDPETIRETAAALRGG